MHEPNSPLPVADNTEPIGEPAPVPEIRPPGHIIDVSPDPSRLFIGCPNHYWSLVNCVHDRDRGGTAERTRNTLALSTSTNLRDWEIARIILHDADTDHTGFQYVDWQFDVNDIVAVSRTAFGNSDNCHNANYFTFHRVDDFRGSSASLSNRQEQ